MSRYVVADLFLPSIGAGVVGGRAHLPREEPVRIDAQQGLRHRHRDHHVAIAVLGLLLWVPQVNVHVSNPLAELGALRNLQVWLTLLVGMVDTLARALLPTVLRTMMPPSQADGLGASLASMTIYILMAAILFFRPSGLFPARGSR